MLQRTAQKEYQAAQSIFSPGLLSSESRKNNLPGQRVVLIIEDNPADVRLMHEAFRDVHPPVAIHVATDGDEALQFMRREGRYSDAPRPSLIFLDFNLPKSNSREILRKLKENAEFRPIPIAVLTTSESERDVRDAYALFANCYLRKPVDLDSFLGTIQAAAHFWLDIAYLPPGEPHQSELPRVGLNNGGLL